MATDYGKWDRIAAEIEADERAEGSARDAQAAAALRQEATARVAAKAPAGDASGAASPGATSNPRGDCDGAAAGAAANTRAGESGPMPTVTDAMIDDMVGRLGLDVKRRKAPARREAREARGRGGPRCDDDGAGGASESKGGGDDDVIEVTGGAGAKIDLTPPPLPPKPPKTASDAALRAAEKALRGGAQLDDIYSAEAAARGAKIAAATPEEADAALRESLRGVREVSVADAARASKKASHGTDYRKWEKIAAELSDDEADASSNGRQGDRPQGPLPAHLRVGGEQQRMTNGQVVETFTLALLLAIAVMWEVGDGTQSWTGKVTFVLVGLGVYWVDMQCTLPEHAQWRDPRDAAKAALWAATGFLLADNVVPVVGDWLSCRLLVGATLAASTTKARRPDWWARVAGANAAEGAKED